MEKNPNFNKRRPFNKAVGPGKKSKINKRRPTFISDYRVHIFIKYWYWSSIIIWKAILVMILQYVFNTGIQYFVWVLQHTLPPTPWVDKPHPLLVFVVVEWPLSETSILASTFYLVCQRNISFFGKTLRQLRDSSLLGPYFSVKERLLI